MTTNPSEAGADPINTESANDYPLVPNSPREKELVERFKRIVVRHLEDIGDKTTNEFLEALGLELWQVTRRG